LEKSILSSLFSSSSSSSFASSVDPTTFSYLKILPLGLIFLLEVEISVRLTFRFIGSLEEITPELLESSEVAVGRLYKYGGNCFFDGMFIALLYDLNYIDFKFKNILSFKKFKLIAITFSRGGVI